MYKEFEGETGLKFQVSYTEEVDRDIYTDNVTFSYRDILGISVEYPNGLVYNNLLPDDINKFFDINEIPQELIEFIK